MAVRHFGSGPDRFFGGPANDVIFGGPGTDFFEGGDGNDQLHGGAGRDNLYGDGGNDLLYGDGGEDFIFGGSGSDVLKGGDGGDRLVSHNNGIPDGHDEVWGGGGNDFLDTSNNYANGGSGREEVDADMGDGSTGKGTVGTLFGGVNQDNFNVFVSPNGQHDVVRIGDLAAGETVTVTSDAVQPDSPNNGFLIFNRGGVTIISDNATIGDHSMSLADFGATAKAVGADIVLTFNGAENDQLILSNVAKDWHF